METGLLNYTIKTLVFPELDIHEITLVKYAELRNELCARNKNVKCPNLLRKYKMKQKCVVSS